MTEADGRSEERILSILREIARTNDGECTTALLAESDWDIDPSTVEEEFGSWPEAKRRAGLYKDNPADEYDETRPVERVDSEYQDDKLLQDLRSCYERYGELSPRDFEKDEEFASVATVIDRYGTWRAAERAVGIETPNRGNRQYSNDELLGMVRRCQAKYGGNCTFQKFKQDDEFPSPETIHRRFGSWDSAKLAAELFSSDSDTDVAEDRSERTGDVEIDINVAYTEGEGLTLSISEKELQDLLTHITDSS